MITMAGYSHMRGKLERWKSLMASWVLESFSESKGKGKNILLFY